MDLRLDSYQKDVLRSKSETKCPIISENRPNIIFKHYSAQFSHTKNQRYPDPNFALKNCVVDKRCRTPYDFSAFTRTDKIWHLVKIFLKLTTKFQDLFKYGKLSVFFKPRANRETGYRTRRNFAQDGKIERLVMQIKGRFIIYLAYPVG